MVTQISAILKATLIILLSLSPSGPNTCPSSLIRAPSFEAATPLATRTPCERATVADPSILVLFTSVICTSSLLAKRTNCAVSRRTTEATCSLADGQRDQQDFDRVRELFDAIYNQKTRIRLTALVTRKVVTYFSTAPPISLKPPFTESNVHVRFWMLATRLISTS